MRKFITVLFLMIGFITTTFAAPSRAHPEWQTTISTEQHDLVSFDCKKEFGEQTTFVSTQMVYQSNITNLNIKAIKVEQLKFIKTKSASVNDLFLPFDYGPNYKPTQISSNNIIRQLSETLTISCGGLPRIRLC